MEGTVMTTLLSNIGVFFTQAISWFGDVLDFVIDNPILLIMCIGMPVCGYIFGLLGRLIRL